MSSSQAGEKQFAVGGETDHGIKLEGKKAQVVQDCLDLFSAKFSMDILERSWNKDAVFSDPIAHAEGREQYAGQWSAMNFFKKSETLAWKVTKDEPPILEWEQRQRYVFPGTGTEKIMQSLIHVELDSDNKVLKLEDRWDGKEIKSGWLATKLRTLNGQLMPSIALDKDEKKQVDKST